MTKQPILLMLKGLPASGKTTYATELEADGWVRANKDDLRVDFPNKPENEIIDLEDVVIVEALEHGHDVVVDDTNFNPFHEKRLRELAEDFGAEFQVMFIDTPPEVCIKRNLKRKKSVPLSAITDMYNKYIAPLRDVEEENDEERDEAIVVDVDGTLAHISADNPRNVYDGSRANEDILDDAVSNVVAMAYGHGYKVIIVTGRSYEHLKVTREWLKEKGVDYDEIYCRNDGDKRPDYEVKEEIYNKHIKNRFQVKYVIDDRPSVCRMWRKKGLKVFQVGDPHNEF